MFRVLLVVLAGCRTPAPAPLRHVGQEQPGAQEILAKDLSHPTALVVHASGVYYCTGDTLARVRDARRFVVEGAELTDVTIVGETAYGIAGGMAIAEIPLVRGDIRERAEVAGFAGALAVDRAGAIWSVAQPNDDHSGQLFAAAHGDAPREIAGKLGNPDSVALAADTVYWVSLDGVFRMSRGGGSITKLAGPSIHSGRRSIRAHGGKLFVLTADGLDVVDARTGTARRLVVTGEDDFVSAFAVDDSDVYYIHVHRGGADKLRRVPRAGGTGVDLADVEDVYSLEVDATAIYWLTDTELVRRAK